MCVYYIFYHTHMEISSSPDLYLFRLWEKTVTPWLNPQDIRRTCKLIIEGTCIAPAGDKTQNLLAMRCTCRFQMYCVLCWWDSRNQMLCRQLYPVSFVSITAPFTLCLTGFPYTLALSLSIFVLPTDPDTTTVCNIQHPLHHSAQNTRNEYYLWLLIISFICCKDWSRFQRTFNLEDFQFPLCKKHRGEKEFKV